MLRLKGCRAANFFIKRRQTATASPLNTIILNNISLGAEVKIATNYLKIQRPVMSGPFHSYLKFGNCVAVQSIEPLNLLRSLIAIGGIFNA